MGVIGTVVTYALGPPYGTRAQATTNILPLMAQTQFTDMIVKLGNGQNFLHVHIVIATTLVIIDVELSWGERIGLTTPKTINIQPNSKKWVEVYPKMQVAHSCPTAVTTSDGSHLVVIRGYDDGGWNPRVELFQVRSRTWYKLADLPQPLLYPSATISGDYS